MLTHMWKTFLAGFLLIVPAWATWLILLTLFTTLDRLVGQHIPAPIPGLGLLLLLLIIVIAGVISTYVVGQRLMAALEHRVTQIPLVQSIYLTIKGMTDLFHFRSRFGRSAVVTFPFPRQGLWALGFVMGSAPPALQVAAPHHLLMVFVPTAIHPFTGYLAFIPETALHPLNLLPEDAMKMEFSAGLFKPGQGWLSHPRHRSSR